MTIASGIHAGGTYTEAVLVNHDSHTVLTGVQALTTRHDLSVGIGQAVSMGSGHSLPVACGHELTTRLNAVRQATTVALNARLIPLLRELIVTVRHTLSELDVTAPLMVVKRDGALVRAEWAQRRLSRRFYRGRRRVRSAHGIWRAVAMYGW